MTMESIPAARRAVAARPSAATANPSPRNAAYATDLLKTSQLRSATIDHQTVAAEPGDEEHERAEQDGAGAADTRSGDSAERDCDEDRRQQDDCTAADRQRPARARAVTGEHRACERRPDEGCEDEGADRGTARGRLRRRVHGGPR